MFSLPAPPKRTPQTGCSPDPEPLPWREGWEYLHVGLGVWLSLYKSGSRGLLMYVARMLLSPQVCLALYVGLCVSLECGCLLPVLKLSVIGMFEIWCSREPCQKCLLTFWNYSGALTQAKQTPHHLHPPVYLCLPKNFTPPGPRHTPFQKSELAWLIRRLQSQPEILGEGCLSLALPSFNGKDPFKHPLHFGPPEWSQLVRLACCWDLNA